MTLTPKKTGLENEFLLVMIRLRQNLHVHDLAFHSKVSDAHVSSIFRMDLTFETRIRDSRNGTQRKQLEIYLPTCLKKHYPKLL